MSNSIKFLPFSWQTLGPVLKCVILATFKGQLVQRPLEALGDPNNHSKASKLTKNQIWSQNKPNIDPLHRGKDFWPSLRMCHPCHFQVPTGFTVAIIHNFQKCRQLSVNLKLRVSQHLLVNLKLFQEMLPWYITWSYLYWTVITRDISRFISFHVSFQENSFLYDQLKHIISGFFLVFFQTDLTLVTLHKHNYEADIWAIITA